MAINSAISLPFSINDAGGVSYTTDLTKIWQDRVVLAVMTSLGERVMRPTFGSTASQATFLNTGEALALVRQAVGVAFSTWLRDLTLLSVAGTSDSGNDNLVLTITYKLRDTDNEQSVTIKTAILSRSGDVLLEVPRTNG
jgi:phage baseplate assembly protein W